MAANSFQRMPQPGDLIEINRGKIQHWAVYIGDGLIIHLTTGPEKTILSISPKATVRKDKMSEVVGTDAYRVNNLLDDTYSPRSPDAIVSDAESRVGQVLPYNLLHRNCEHFATELRYGKPESRQVREAIEAVGEAAAAVVGTASGSGVLASVQVLASSSRSCS
ncbi:hypothetical protein COCON_G00065200 [Conger conger]|uniref:LRAT domain-containing protein n=1 Tax=Conger conger TaxID=82655 RepID=A0A9Q1I352_CONCO|nr:phospholipase A and acyltransferase 4-like [Conger conger]KAJ8279454.1 hypothetical protein COCON_G00065200 [Conger conger]